MTLRLRMQKFADGAPGTWLPAFSCDRCLCPVLHEGRAMWDAGADEQLCGAPVVVAGFLVVCSAACEQQTRVSVTDVAQWATMPMAALVAYLAVTTRTVEAVSDRLEDVAFGQYVKAQKSATHEQNKKERT